MGIIALEGIALYGRHGHYTYEEALGSQYLLDVYVRHDISKAGQTDDLDDTVNYEVVYGRCVELFHQRHRLLEALAYKMAHDLVDNVGVMGARIRIRKMHPPLPGIVNSSSVEYTTPGFTS